MMGFVVLDGWALGKKGNSDWVINVLFCVNNVIGIL